MGEYDVVDPVSMRLNLFSKVGKFSALWLRIRRRERRRRKVRSSWRTIEEVEVQIPGTYQTVSTAGISACELEEFPNEAK